MMTIAIVLPVIQGLKQGIRNGFSIQELVGTVVIQFGIGLFTGLCIIVFMFTLFWVIAGLVIAKDYFTGRLRRK